MQKSENQDDGSKILHKDETAKEVGKKSNHSESNP